MLCAVLMIAGCEKEPIPPVVTDPLVIDPDCFVDLSMRRNHFIDSTTTYSGNVILRDHNDIGVDPGQVFYASTPMLRQVNNADTFYRWPDMTTPMEPGKVWSISANRLMHAAALTDMVAFPTLDVFPDTLKRSTHYTFSLATGRATNIWLDHPPYNEESANDVFQTIDVTSNSGTLYLQQSQKDALGDSAYIHVYAKADTLAGTSVRFTKIAHWAKWVSVVE